MSARFILASVGLVLSISITLRAEQPKAEDPAIAAFRAKLEKPATLRVTDVPISRLLELLAKNADVPLKMANRVENDAFNLHMSLNVQNARSIDILDAMRDILSLPYDIRNTGVVFNGGQAVGEGVVMRLYSVDDLTTAVPDAPLDQGIEPPNMAGAAGFAPPPSLLPTLTNMADMIRNRIRPESWDPALGTSIEERGGMLWVMQREGVHADIRELLSEFRVKSRRQVGVDLRALSIKSTDIDRLRQDIKQRGGTWPTLDKEALAAIDKWLQDGSAAGIFEGSTICFNGQRTRLDHTEYRQVLADYDIAGEAYDPVIRKLSCGWTSTLQPILSDDTSRVSLNLRIHQSEAVGNAELFTINRGGLMQIPGQPSTITIKQRKTMAPTASAEAPKVPEKPEEAKVADANAPAQPAPPVPPPQTVEDVTREFDIQSSGAAGPTVQSNGPLQVELQTMAGTRIKQDLVLPAGKSVAVCAPLYSKEGFEPGREMLTIVRCNPLDAALAPKAAAHDGGVADLQALTQKLQKPITVALGEIPLTHAIQALSIHTGVPAVIDLPALDGQLQNSVKMDFDNARGEEILNLILKSGDCSAIRYPSLLLFTTPNKAGSRGAQLRIFDIHDLTHAVSDYPLETGRETVLAPTNPYQTGPEVRSTLAAADIQVLIKEKLFPAEFADPATSIEESNDKLIVMNTPAVLTKIEKVLNDLRGLWRRVDVTAHWAVVNSADLRAALGAELPHTLDAAQCEKIVEIIAQPASRDLATVRLNTRHGQRVSAFGGITRPAVVDYDVAGNALDPVVENILSGVKCDVVPLVAENAGGADKNQIHLNAMLSLSKMDPRVATMDPVVPGAHIAPSLPPQPGKIHTPKVQTQEIKNSVRVEDGGAALFRLPPPAWLQGEDAEALKRGQRTLIVLLQAQTAKN